MNESAKVPCIVGIGGTATGKSSTELALSLALAAAREAGAQTQLFGGATLVHLPHYLTHDPDFRGLHDFVSSIRSADGLIIASPGYHGSVSGLVKNALDYIEETSTDNRVYLSDLPVGLIATARGWQATGSTLAALRSIVHALRGWPTPLGIAINTSDTPFRDGACVDQRILRQISLCGRQVVEFARRRMCEIA